MQIDDIVFRLESSAMTPRIQQGSSLGPLLLVY